MWPFKKRTPAPPIQLPKLGETRLVTMHAGLFGVVISNRNFEREMVLPCGEKYTVEEEWCIGVDRFGQQPWAKWRAKRVILTPEQAACSDAPVQPSSIWHPWRLTS
jgi:hypothetical protein